MDEYTKISNSFSKLKDDLTGDLLSAGYLTGIILGIIGFVILIKEVGTFYKINQISKWPIVEKGALVIDSYMENISSSRTYSILVMSQTDYSINYRNRVSFIYKVKSQFYIGSQLSYNEPWDPNPVHSRLENTTYKKGSKVDVRINPNNPSEAYILNKPYVNYLPAVIGLLLSIIGIYSIIKM